MLYQIKPHASLLVHALVHSFEFQSSTSLPMRRIWFCNRFSPKKQISNKRIKTP